MQIPTNFETIKKIFLGIGTVALAGSAYMTWKFGASISNAHGVGLLMATIAAAFIFPAKRFIEMAGASKTTLRTLGVCGVALIGAEFLADLGYTFGMRDKQQVEAGAQNVAYTAVQDNLKSERDNISMWRAQLADLKKRNAAHAERNKGWLVTVDPVAMQEQMTTLDLLIENEGKRVRCAQKCEALKKQKADLAATIANVKEENDLTARIDATQRIIDGKVNTATTTKVGHSTTKAQNASFAKMALFFSGEDADKALKPGDTALDFTDMTLGVIMAATATFLPTLCFYIAFFGVGPVAAAPVRHKPIEPLTVSVPQVAATSANVNTNADVYMIKDDAGVNAARQLRQTIRNAIEQAGGRPLASGV